MCMVCARYCDCIQYVNETDVMVAYTPCLKKNDSDVAHYDFNAH